MGIFSGIYDKIFGHHPAAAAQPAPAATPAGAGAAAGAAVGAAVAHQAPAAAPAAPAQQVDVEAVLTQMASTAPGHGGNWRTSIVDLLKMLGLDSSLAARKELANELNIHVGADGSAEENIALHKAVMRKLAENGGKVPASLRD